MRTGRRSADFFDRLFFLAVVRIVVLYEPAPHLFHGGDGRLARRRREHRARPVLKLSRSLGRDDDEPVRASLAVVRNCVCCVYPLRHSLNRLLSRSFPVSGESAAPSASFWRARRAQSTSACPPTPPRRHSRQR